MRDKKNLGVILGGLAAVVGFGATLLTNYATSKEIEADVDEAVSKALADRDSDIENDDEEEES